MTDKEVLQARGRRGLRQHHRERKMRGWSIFDAWSAEDHLLRLIGEMALHLRDHGHGYPASLTEEEWHDILTRIGEPLVEYVKDHYEWMYLSEDDPRTSASEALELFASWHADFWD